jgi:hypothetical protein
MGRKLIPLEEYIAKVSEHRLIQYDHASASGRLLMMVVRERYVSFVIRLCGAV